MKEPATLAEALLLRHHFRHPGDTTGLIQFPPQGELSGWAVQASKASPPVANSTAIDCLEMLID
jgi:hypothetical protein